MTVFGLGLDARKALEQAKLADREGLDHVSVSDHPYLAHLPDAYATIGFLLGATTRVSGLVNVTNLPTRPAPMLARTVTSLSELSGGRIVLGMGAGGSWPDIAKLGVAPLTPAQAVRAMGEAITVVRALSGGGGPVSFEGEFYRFDGLVPSRVAAPPVWTGSVGPSSLAVTGRLADGWIPGHAADWLSPRYNESRPIIDAAAAEAGRDPREVATIYNLPGRITNAPLNRTRDEQGRWIGGSVEQWVEELTIAIKEFGAGGFTYFPGNDLEIGRWAGEIVPALRD
ncbi:LLM class flavin-dependent oxidoreductase [Nonomuraea sp. NPDC050556]|uniref:LLM class flavin-dependent oxidoreductase n=1 Tax=Nonomuraea sp. NPDC050556 TaxID=3364369 RepID=UPI0037895CA8